MQNFVVYKSSAGSGKTYTLVKEYLRLALFDEKKLNFSYKRILAVTFTNKAAAEMKERVLKALRDICDDPEMPVVGKQLCADLSVTENELRRRAQIVLSGILHHYSDFSISTIDSFTHKIVKTFAHDLKLPVNFNIEMDTEGFYGKVISALFSKIGEDEYVSRLLREYALHKAEDNATWDPEGHILSFTKLLSKEDATGYLDKLRSFGTDELELFRTEFIGFIRHYRETLRSDGKKAIDLIRSHHLTDEDFTYRKTGPQSFFYKCAEGNATLQDADGSRINEAIEKNKWAARGSETKVNAIAKELNTYAGTLVSFIRENYTYYSLCELLNSQMYPLMLLKKIEEISNEQKQEERLVFISEFNQKIFDIIHREPTPFIYERLGERYQHYLLDEFQDTSSLQWQNVLPLLDNSLSNGWFNLLVGDGKQSIYRWRNANVRQFAGLPAIDNPSENPVIEERAQSLRRNYEEKILNTNYRSLKNVIAFNNDFFEVTNQALLSGPLQNIYASHAQVINSSSDGYVTVETGKAEPADLEQVTCEKTIALIQKALLDGFSYRDICVLCRTNRHGNSLADFLMDREIPVLSSDSLLLKNNLEVNTIVCYLKHLVNKDDTVSGAAVLNYLRQTGKISQESFHTACSRLTEGLPLHDILASFDIRMNSGDRQIHNLLDHCIRISEAIGLTRSGYQYVRFFLDEVNEFLVTENSNVQQFIDWWDNRRNRASMVVPDSTNAVSIMTIHSSKGLEFPVVIIPFCNWSVYKANENWVNIRNEKVRLPVSIINLTKKATDSGFTEEFESEQQEQVLDNLNLLYVAFTRAVERLHVLAISSTGSKAESVSDWIGSYIQKHPEYAGNMLTLGTPHPKTATHKMKSPVAFDLHPLAFDTPEDSIRIKSSWLYNNEESEHARKQGLIIHLLLSRIQTTADIDLVIHNAVLEGITNVAQGGELKEKILEMIRLPVLNDAYSGKYPFQNRS